MTYGFPNHVLWAHGIDPDILQDLTEELREELLASVEYNPAQQQQL